MFKETLHVTLSEEQDKRDTFHSIVWGSVVVFGMLALLIHGLAFMSWTDKTNEDIYECIYMTNQIKDLQHWKNEMIIDYGKHTHRYYDGRIKND